MIAFEQEGISEQGPVRDQNEDTLASHVPDDPAVRERKGCMWVVADGVSGHRAGEVASRLAAKTLIDGYFSNAKKPMPALRAAFSAANLHICDLGMTNAEYRRMETTLTALVLVGNQALIGHVGDTRVYRIRHGAVEQLTSDHSEVGELVRMQILTPEEAQKHPRRHIITRSIGSELLTQADFRTETVETGDVFVLCSDGLWEPLSDTDIAAQVDSSARDSARRLISLALERESSDNLSVHVVRVTDVPPPPEAARSPGFLRRALRRLLPS